MKYLIVLVATFLCSGVSYGQTDDYIPYISSDKEWYIDGKRYIFSEDSIWQDQWYRERLVYDGPDDQEPASAGLFREEGGRVYQWIGPEATDEIVFFDLTLMVGDTIGPLGEDGNNDLGIVTNVDTIMYSDSIPRKRITMDCLEYLEVPMYWIEGVGAEYGLVRFCTVGHVLRDVLYCYYENGERLYEYPWLPNSDNCYRATINVEDELAPVIHLSPNPVQTILTLAGEQLPDRYSIYDMTGRLLASADLIGDQISVADLQRGIYALVVTDKKGQMSTLRFEKR